MHQPESPALGKPPTQLSVPHRSCQNPHCPAKARQGRQRTDSTARVPSGTMAVQLNTNSHVVVQSLSRVRLFVTLWTAAHQAFLSFTISQSLLKLMSIESVMLFNHLILCCSLFLLPSIFPTIRVFSNELALHIRWPKYWSFSFSISPSNEHPGLISFGMD